MPYPHPISDPNSALASGQNGKAAARRPEPVIPAEYRREREPASRIDTLVNDRLKYDRVHRLAEGDNFTHVKLAQQFGAE